MFKRYRKASQSPIPSWAINQQVLIIFFCAFRNKGEGAPAISDLVQRENNGTGYWIVNISDSYFGRQQYVIYCSQLRATPSADCNISHIAAGLSNYLIHICWPVFYEGWLPPKLSLEFYYAVCRCGFSCFQWCFWCYKLYLTCTRWCSPKRRCCFVCSVWCYTKPRCYYSCPYGVMRNLDAIIRVSNFVCVNPGLQRARPLWSGASDN